MRLNPLLTFSLFAAAKAFGTEVVSLPNERDGCHVAVIEPEGVGVSPNSRWVCETAEVSNTVTLFDTRRNAVVACFFVDARPRAAIFSSDGRVAWISSEVGGMIFEVDVARHAIRRYLELPRGSRPVGIVAVVDRSSLGLEKTIPVGQRPWGIAVSGDGKQVSAASSLSNTVSVILVVTGEVTAIIPTSNWPWGIAAGGAATSTVTRDNDAARYAFARVPGGRAPEVIRSAVNDNTGSAKVKQRVMTLPLERHFGQDCLQPAGAFLGDNKVWKVSGVMTAAGAVVRLATRIEMRSCAFECRRLASRLLVDVDPVGTRAQSVHFNDDADIVSGGRKSCRPDAVALRITDLRSGAGGTGRAAPAQQCRDHERAHESCDRIDSHVFRDAREHQMVLYLLV